MGVERHLLGDGAGFVGGGVERTQVVVVQVGRGARWRGSGEGVGDDREAADEVFLGDDAVAVDALKGPAGGVDRSGRGGCDLVALVAGAVGAVGSDD